MLFRSQLMREGEDRRRYLSKAGLCAAAMIVAMLINARGLLPQYYNATKVSKRVEQTVSSGDAAVDEARKNFSTSWSLHPEEVASLVVPEFAGYNQGYWGRNYFKINVEYFGLLPVALALAGFAGLYQSSLFLFFAALGAFGITFGLGAHLPVHGIVAAVLPGIKSLRGPSMMAILTAFSASVMAALALQALLKSPDKKHRQRDKRGTMLGVLVGITGVFLISSIATESILSLWTTIFDYAPTAGKLQAYQANIPLLTKASMIALVFLGSVTALLFAYRAKKVSLMVIVCVMACVSLIDNWRINTQFMRLTTPDYHGTGKMPTVPAFEWLKDNDTSKYRIFPLYNPQGRLFYDGINSVSGQHDFTLQRYDVLMANLNNFGILNLANVKYFVSQQPVQALQNFNIVYNDKQLLIYENPNAYPFVYLATAAQIETDEEVILDALRSNTRFEQTVILEVEPNPEWGLADQPVAGGSVTVVDMDVSAGRYEMDVDAPAPGVVVVSDNFHPHWTATVNANEVEILHANYFWKGVVVAAGKSRIVMQFQTPLIDTSRRISQAGVLIFFLAGLWVGVQYLRERKAGAVTVADA